MDNAKAGIVALVGGALTGGCVYYFFFHKKASAAPLAAKALPTLGTQVSSYSPKPAASKTPAYVAPSYSTPSAPVEASYSDRKPSGASSSTAAVVVDKGEVTDPSGLPWSYTITRSGTDGRLDAAPTFSWTVRYVGPSNRVYGIPAPMGGKGAGTASIALDRVHTAVIGWTTRKQEEAADEGVSSVFG